MSRGTRARDDPMLRDGLLSDAVQRVVEDGQPAQAERAWQNKIYGVD
jgi:hypothetical protein